MFYLVSLLLSLLIAPCILASDYHERLLLRPLPQSALLASFNFRSNATIRAFDQQNFRYFPRSLGQILQHAHTKELHLRFSLGRWDAEGWGKQPWNGAREGGTGVELWAWVEAPTDEAANARWLTLTNALSGLFCASLNFIDSSRTIRPMQTFEPEGVHPLDSTSNLHLLHGTLPHEVVCTENLTPFLKLLPCKGKAGISSLLDGHKLFDASWQTMAIDVRPLCHGKERDDNCILEIEQTVDMVLDISRAKRPRDNPIPRPVPIEEIRCDESKSYNSHDSCYPLDRLSEPSWTLTEVFGRPIAGACPITSSDTEVAETVCINIPKDREVEIKTSEKPNAFVETSYDEGELRCFKINEDAGDFELVLPEQTIPNGISLQNPTLHTARFITGSGQERGGIQTIITNTSPHDQSIVYLESLPWFMRPYLHTLRATSSGLSHSSHPATEEAIEEIFYKPALDRHRGTHLEIKLRVPAQSRLTLTYDFEKAILRYTEYPPDANRGFDVAAAVIRILDSPSSSSSTAADTVGKGRYLRTTTLLLYLPTPDFSMPYNVIILTSTVMALGFGGVFNLLVRRFVGVDEIGESRIQVILGVLRERVKVKLAGLRTTKGKTE